MGFLIEMMYMLLKALSLIRMLRQPLVLFARQFFLQCSIAKVMLMKFHDMLVHLMYFPIVAVAIVVAVVIVIAIHASTPSPSPRPSPAPRLGPGHGPSQSPRPAPARYWR